MSHCFLVGSERNGKREHCLRVLHYIEYLIYNLENKVVSICADFFVKNISRKPACLRGLHRGNIHFTSETAQWFEDTQWTPVLLELAREEMGLIRSGDDEIYGGAGNDTMTGGPGSDRFVFTAADIGSTPETDTIIDFNTSMGDILDLSQLLIGLSPTPDGAELATYLSFTFNGTDTIIQIDADGDGSGTDLYIVLEGVDLPSEAGSSSSADIIQYLLDNGQLVVE